VNAKRANDDLGNQTFDRQGIELTRRLRFRQKYRVPSPAKKTPDRFGCPVRLLLMRLTNPTPTLPRFEN